MIARAKNPVDLLSENKNRAARIVCKKTLEDVFSVIQFHLELLLRRGMVQAAKVFNDVALVRREERPGHAC